MLRPLMLLPIVLATATDLAFSDPVSISGTRNIHGHALVLIDGLPVASRNFEQVATPLGSFSADRSAHAAIGPNSAASAAAQHTTIGVTHWFGSGSAAATAGGDVGLNVGSAISVMGVTFSIVKRTRYQFYGSIGAAGGSTALLALGSGSSSIWRDGFGLSVDDMLPDFRTAAIQHDGVLQPGSYSFFAQAQSTAGLDDRTTPGRATFDFDFELRGSPVPEPASGWLVGSALVICGYRYRRAKTRRLASSRAASE